MAAQLGREGLGPCLLDSSGMRLVRIAASPIMAGAVRHFLMLVPSADISSTPAAEQGLGSQHRRTGVSGLKALSVTSFLHFQPRHYYLGIS